MQKPKYELISFALCPYVQRSVIMLKHKKIDFTITYVDLSALPEWFDKVSPLGKVPVLLVHEKSAPRPTALFESAVINEYLDEVTPPMLLPADPLAKAYDRAWVAVSGDLLMAIYTIMTSEERSEVGEARDEIFEILDRVEGALPGGTYFRGTEFSLVDAAFAPFFMRVRLLKDLRDDALWRDLPKVKEWSDALLRLPEVRDSVVPDFEDRFAEYLRENGRSAAAVA